MIDDKMMLLTFEQFMAVLKDYRKTGLRTKRQLHYAETETEFHLYLKSVEFWKYHTTIKKEDLHVFGAEYGVNPEQAADDFRAHVLYDSLEIAEPLDDEEEPEEKTIALPEKSFKAASKFILEDDAKEYDVFLSNLFAHWEKEILRFVDKELKEELHTEEKQFGGFLSGLFNTIVTLAFFEKIRRIIKIKFMEGAEEAEKELDVNVELGDDFDQRIDREASRQLEGFTLDDGSQWKGIKGVAEDVQQDMRVIVGQGIDEGKTIEKVKDDIKDKMTQYKGGTRVSGSVTEGRAMRIARTESNRYVNQGKLEVYKRSGLSGKKQWLAAEPRGCKNCSPICDALQRKKAGLDEMFSARGWTGEAPPAHPNCRSTLKFVPE